MMTLEELEAEFKKLKARLDAQENPPSSKLVSPTPKELKDEIEKGPLADKLAKYWNDVFGEHHKKELQFRVGKLKCDAAYDIQQILIKKRCEELGWSTNWPYKLIIRAKEL